MQARKNQVLVASHRFARSLGRETACSPPQGAGVLRVAPEVDAAGQTEPRFAPAAFRPYRDLMAAVRNRAETLERAASTRPTLPG